MATKILGDKGESYAAKLLTSKGYKIIDRNFKSKVGEIDLIALKDGALIFIEVKTRKSSKFGFPEEAVTRWKLRKIARVGEFYSILHPEYPKKIRIDVVSLLLDHDVLVREKIIQTEQ